MAPVRNRLAELQQTAAAWRPADDPLPPWQSKITPEHEQRKRHCEFVDTDGQVHVFDLHARFTPRHGRLHFRVLRANGTIRIAHIGAKLGV